MSTPVDPTRRGGPPSLDRLPDARDRRQWARLYLSSLRSGRQPAPGVDIDEVERFCFFIGYARSGHTLVATLLNAHPDMVIAHELDAVRFIRHHFRRSQLYSLLVQRDTQFGQIGRTWSGYAYEVPGQYQGKVERLRVIGDKRARSTVLQIAERPALLDRVRRVVKVPIRVLHVTRNPFDNIATEARRHNMSLTQATSWYEQICEAVRVVRPLLDPGELVDVRYEDFVADTGAALADLCGFLEVQAEAPYLDACAAIVWPSTNRTRDAVEWSPAERRGVEHLIERFEALHGYQFDN